MVFVGILCKMKKQVAFILAMLVSTFAWSKKGVKQPLSLEREQQFTYYWFAARQSLEQEQYAKALQQFQFCEQLNPKDALTKEYIGILNEVLGHDSTALDCYQKAYQLDPSERWYRYAVTLSKLKTEQADKTLLQIHRQVVKMHPDDAGCWENLYVAAVNQGEYKEALNAVNKATEIEGYNALNAYHRYHVYLCLGKKKKALQALDDYLVAEPYDLRILLLKVQFLTIIHAPVSQQIEALQAVLRVDPSNLMTLNNYAYLLATSGGDLRQAEQMSLQTIREQPENAIFLDTYAWILHLQGQDALAGFYIRKALQNAQEDDKKEIEEHYKVIIK